jgi:hypothetical protein
MDDVLGAKFGSGKHPPEVAKSTLGLWLLVGIRTMRGQSTAFQKP